MKKAALVFAVLLMAVGMSAQAASKQYVHVYVNDTDEDEKVKVNIPLSLVETMLPMIDEKDLNNGKIKVHDKDFDVRELKKMWDAVKAEGDNEYMSIEKKDMTLKVAVQGNYFIAETSESSDKQVHIKVPLSVVDALFSGKADELNLMAAVQALKDSGVKDIISIKDDDTSVRVWIDEYNQIR